MNDEHYTPPNRAQENERDDTLYEQWTERTGHDPSQPLTDEQWQDFYTTWSRETEQPIDPEQLHANPFHEDMHVQELGPDSTPPLAELMDEKDLTIDQDYLQELDEKDLLADDPQPDVEPRLIEAKDLDLER